MELKDKQQLQKLIENKATVNFGISLKEANSNQFYKCVSMAVRDLLTEQRYEFKKQVRKQNSKQIYYMSMEFLLGRSLKNHLFNMGITDIVDEIATSYGWKMDDIYACEPDAGLGNGGLGRLAAAYMESLTNMNYAANGFSIKYDYGIFKQKIADGWQVELPDQWLDDGAVWLTPRKEDTFTVRFGGRINQRWEGDRLFIDYEDCDIVEATPYDMNISGYNSFAVNKLRLWTASAPKVFDMQLFSEGQYVKSTEAQSLAESICRVLYPADHHVEGKMLRLKQQYFFVSASIQSILKTHIAQYGTLDNLGDKVAIHINDTHPTLCIPELMRLLLDEYGYDWDKAWGIVTKTISYTNHTVMAEALEKWPANLFERLLPRIYQIVCEINSRFCNDLWNFYPNDWNKVSYNAILSHNQIKMANLCLAASHTINGVSELHSDILKRDVFDDYYRMYPDKFTNVTNGITYRRWLCQANPRLTGFVRDLIGDGFLKDANELKKLERYKGKQDVLAQINAIKLANKQDLAAYIAKETGEKIDPNSIFDVQVKRLHEYKRQLLNVLHIMHTYYALKDNPSLDITPRTYIFGAKAAPSYYMAKQIIRLICQLGNVINNDPDVNEKLKVVFMENYRVSLAEMIMPASDVSEQISVAGKEASGTGNMKFMINGAVTIGTMDGANIEIHERVGDDNIFIFGLLADEVERLSREGYQPSKYYNEDERIRRIIDNLRQGIGGVGMSEVADCLINSDTFKVLADFSSYCEAQDKLDRAFADRERWGRMSLMNTANAGFFSSDRSIKEYADRIWHIKPVRSGAKK